jgi:intraflagellar transport protein 140
VYIYNLCYPTNYPNRYSLGNTDDLVTTVLATAWSSTDQPVLASSSADGSISFFNEEGVALEMKEHRHLLNRQPAVCNKLAWHPRLPILAMGWSDGCVSVFDETTKILKVDTLMHVTPITFITWSPEGSRLITGDERGFLAVWDRDNSRKLRVRARHEKEGPITHLCFRAPEPGSYR